MSSTSSSLTSLSIMCVALALVGLPACDRSSSSGGSSSKSATSNAPESSESGESGASSKQDESSESETPSGGEDDVPEIRARPFSSDSGDPVALSTQSTPTLVNLWATWCAPCVAELPRLGEVRDQWSSEQLRMIGLSMEGPKSRDKIESFARDHDVPFDIWFAPESNPLPKFKASAVPATYLYSADGTLLWSHDGKIESKQLESLEKAVKQAVSEG